MIAIPLLRHRVARTIRIGLLASLSALASCRSAASEPEAASSRSDFLVTGKSGEELTLAPGTTLEVPDANLRIRLVDLADSRCPTKALIQCVWAGSVVTQLAVSAIDGDAMTVSLRLETVAGRDSGVAHGKTIHLLRVTPEKEFIEAIPAERYRVILRVGAPK